MNIKRIDLLIYLLVFFSILSFFLGFYYDENSAGAGTLNGDFKNVWLNLNTFIKYNLNEALELVKLGERDYYISSRTPILYILNAKLNPFVFSINSFIKSIFIFSFLGFFIFYYLLKLKFHNIEKKLLILIASCLLLSPYYRTSSFWGLEENYGIITLLISLYFYQSLLFNVSIKKSYFFKNIFLVTFFSSLSVYLDQKLIIVPFLIFLELLRSNLKLASKKSLILFYFLFSLPYIYFIFQWNNIVPTGDASGRSVGSKFIYYHPVYTSTIIAFYIFPLLFFKNNLSINLKILVNNKYKFLLLFFYIIYLIILFIFHDINSEPLIGKGIIHKFSNKFIDNSFFNQLFIYFVSFFSFVLILIFVEKNLIKILFVLFLYLMSIFTYPLQQEYFDPIVLIIFFGFLEKNLSINKINSLCLFLYLISFLLIANIYYNSIL